MSRDWNITTAPAPRSGLRSAASGRPEPVAHRPHSCVAARTELPAQGHSDRLRPAAGIALTPDDRQFLALAALFDPARASEAGPARIGAAVRRGRDRVRSREADAAGLTGLAEAVGMDGAWRNEMLWMMRHRAEAPDRYFTRAELFRLGTGAGDPPPAGWGAPALPLDGCLCVRIPEGFGVDRARARARIEDYVAMQVGPGLPLRAPEPPPRQLALRPMRNRRLPRALPPAPRAALAVLAAVAALAAAPPAQEAAPALIIEEPTADAYLVDRVRLRATVTGVVAVEAVEFFVDGAPACAAPAPDFTCAWEAGTRVRARVVRAVARLADGGRLVRSVRTRDRPETFFTAETSLVLVPIVVRDRRGRFVDGLTRDDFAIFENEVRQEIQFFETREVPLDLVLAVDFSSSVAPVVRPLRRAARRFVRANGADRHTGGV